MQENPHESVYNYGVSIQDKLPKFKGLLRNPDAILTALIIGVSLTSFALGRISVGNDLVPETGKAEAIGATNSALRENLKPTNPLQMASTTQGETRTQKGYVASKSGTKYHLPWCGSAKQIKEENKIWFDTKEEAEKAGYTPASNCKGI